MNMKFRALRVEKGEVKTGRLSQMEFHVTDATKAPASAVAVVEAGNDIVLSKRKGGSYIENTKSGEKVYLRKKGGTYVFDAEWEEEVDEEAMNVEEEEDVAAVFSRQG